MQLFANLTSVEHDPATFAAQAEAAGFDGVTCSDHYWLRSAFPHLWVTLAAMACATERVTVAPSFANNLFRSPVEFAQASLAMARLSGGRYEAGLGAGWTEKELVATGQVFPDGPTRARRYREALLIARELMTTGSCRFEGEHYHVDVPVFGPLHDPPPPLVASVGGPWTIRNITPLVDRVELKFGRSTRGGALDVTALAEVTRAELGGMVADVRRVREDVPVGVFVLIAVGDGAEVRAFADALGNNLLGGFTGEAKRVLDNLRALEAVGISRVQVTEMVKGSIAELGSVMSE